MNHCIVLLSKIFQTLKEKERIKYEQLERNCQPVPSSLDPVSVFVCLIYLLSTNGIQTLVIVMNNSTAITDNQNVAIVFSDNIAILCNILYLFIVLFLVHVTKSFIRSIPPGRKLVNACKRVGNVKS